MGTEPSTSHDSVLKRVLWLYGLYMLLFNATYLIGYYILPEGLMRGSPQAALGRMATTGVFWSEFARTLLFNSVLVGGLAVVLNLYRVKDFPLGYALPITLGVVSGLVAGTNSFTSSDLRQFNAHDGMALALSVGNLEMLAYILVIASTVSLGMYQYRNWRDTKPTRSRRLRDVRLTRAEAICFAFGIVLLIVAAYRETVMALSA